MKTLKTGLFYIGLLVVMVILLYGFWLAINDPVAQTDACRIAQNSLECQASLR
jgi:hypothetical protein